MDCRGKHRAGEKDQAPRPGTAKPFLALALLALLGILAWWLNPSPSPLQPAPLNPDVSQKAQTQSPGLKGILPTSFTLLPGVDLAKLTAEQKQQVLLRLNTEPCPCGCGNTLAGCRVNDSSCETSLDLAHRVVSQANAPQPRS